MNEIIKAKKKKFVIITLIILVICIVVSLLLFVMFGTIDYFRALKGRKPIFTYNTISATNFDIEMAGFEKAALNAKEDITYYGIGYIVSTCDSTTNKYSFKLGDKKSKECYTSLNCTSDKGTLTLNDDNTVSYNENDKDNYRYTFFEDKLVQVTAYLIRPISSIPNIETASKEINEFYDSIPGCAGMGKKISDEAYETIIMCNVTKMSKEDIENNLPIRNQDLLNYTRTEMIDYHHNDLICR